MTTCEQLTVCLEHAKNCEKCQAKLRSFYASMLGTLTASKMSKAARVRRAKKASESAGRCGHCGKPGHYRKNCPELTRKPGGKSAKVTKSAKPPAARPARKS